MGELSAKPGTLSTVDVAVDPSGTLVVRIGGELDLSTIPDLQARVEPLRTDATRMIVDVGDLKFADSSAIALWVRWASAIDAFELRDPPPIVRRVITAMGLGERLGLSS